MSVLIYLPCCNHIPGFDIKPVERDPGEKAWWYMLRRIESAPFLQ
jgi:hypothetical protein